MPQKTENGIRLAAEIEAVRYIEGSTGDIYRLLGYEVQADSENHYKVFMTEAVPEDAPHVTFVALWVDEAPRLELSLPVPGEGTTLNLEYGMWLVRIGGGFAVMTDKQFQKIEIVL